MLIDCANDDNVKNRKIIISHNNTIQKMTVIWHGDKFTHIELIYSFPTFLTSISKGDRNLILYFDT